MAIKSGISSEPKKPKPSAPATGVAEDPMRSSLRAELNGDDGDDEFDDDDEGSALEDKKGLTPIQIGLLIGGAVIIAIACFFIFKPKPAPLPPAPPPATPTPVPIDQDALDRQALYEEGIGKNYVFEENIFEQGNLESPKFRKDFQGEDQPEKFMTPIKINTVTDSISYVKHRATMGPGIETYWLEGMYHDSPCHLTIPYSIYQSIAEEGTIDVRVEVVTDRSGSRTVTSFTAIAPQQSR